MNQAGMRMDASQQALAIGANDLLAFDIISQGLGDRVIDCKQSLAFHVLQVNAEPS